MKLNQEILAIYVMSRGVASNEAEEAVASSLFCVRTRRSIGDVLACAK